MHRVPMMRMQAGADAGEIDLAMPARAPRVRWTFSSLAQHTDRFAAERRRRPIPRGSTVRARAWSRTRRVVPRSFAASTTPMRRAVRSMPRWISRGVSTYAQSSSAWGRRRCCANPKAPSSWRGPPAQTRRKDAEYKIVYGMPGESLVHAANEIGATLIVVGSRARGRIATALRGSASADVIARSACPVLVVPNANA